MKQSIYMFLLVLALVRGTATALAAEAQQPVPDTNAISIAALVSQTLEENPEIQFYEAEIKAAQAGRKTAGLLANPELSVSAGYKEARGSGLAAEGVAWSVSMAQPFEWPGRIGLRKAIANRDLELAELGLARFRHALAGRVRILAYGVFVAQEQASVAREVADRFRELREVLVQRDPAGLTPLLEMRVIEATELTMQRKASEAALAVQAALLELNQLRGVSPGALLTIAPAPFEFRPAEELETLRLRARTNNFELRWRAVELAQQGFRVALAQNERFPSISVGPTFSEERAGERERVIGLGVSLPLPLWNRNTSNTEAAQARQMQAETSLRLAEREVERKVIEAAQTYETKLREMSQWRPDAIAHFQEAAELADRHYRLGAVPIATYLELQKQYLEAVEGLLQTRQEALAAALQLELLTARPNGLIVTPAEEQP